MSKINAIVNECKEIMKNPKREVEEWKSVDPNRKAIGYFPTYIPEEILYAGGILPVGVFGSSIPVTQANSHIQQITCSIVQSTTELKLTGRLDVLDGMVFPPTCDSAQFVASIWDVAFKDIITDMVMFPSKLTPISVSYITAELEDFARRLEKNFDVTIEEEKVAEAITLYNEYRRLVKRFTELRTKKGFDLSWVDYYSVLKAGTMTDKKKYNQLLSQLVAEIESKVSNESIDSIKIMVVGTSCQIPHVNLLDKVEKLGATVVWDDLLHGLRGIEVQDGDSSPYERLAQAYVESEPMAYRHSPNSPRHEFLLKEYKRVGAHGVVFMIPKFCEPELFDYAYLKKEFEKNGVRHLYTDFEEESSVAEGFETRLQAFIEMLEIVCL